jgi:hypothetical protein
MHVLIIEYSTTKKYFPAVSPTQNHEVFIRTNPIKGARACVWGANEDQAHYADPRSRESRNENVFHRLQTANP